MTKYLLVFSLVLYAIVGNCQKVNLVNKKLLYDSADWIFIGDAYEVTDSLFYVRLIECFKGNPKGNLIGISKDKEKKVDTGIWLFYADSISDSTFSISYDSGSKSFHYPRSNTNITNIAPPPPTIFSSEEKLFFLNLLLDNLAYNELFYELEYLRYLQDIEETEDVNERMLAIEKKFDNVLAQNEKLQMFIFVLAFLFVLSIFIQFIKK